MASPANAAKSKAEHPSVTRPGQVAVFPRPVAPMALSAPTGAVPPPEASPSVGPPPLQVRTATPTAPGPVSHLAEQNDLFSDAMAAERLGQPDTALRKLDRLIERFPESPLGESARAERARILSVQSPR